MNNLQIINNSFKYCFDKATTFYSAVKTSDIDKEASNLITKTIPRELDTYLSNNDYIVNGSIGKGLATKSPWIAILDKKVTKSTQKGVYIVFIFSSDYKHVYLALNQGTTIPGKFGSRLGKNDIAYNSKQIRNLLNISDTILKTDGNANIADDRYRAGSIIHYGIRKTHKKEKKFSIFISVYIKNTRSC